MFIIFIILLVINITLINGYQFNKFYHKITIKNIINSYKRRNLFKVQSAAVNAIESHPINRCEQYANYIRLNKRWGGPIGPIVRYFNICFIGIVFTIILKVLNKFKTIRKNVLYDLIWKRKSDVGLLTVSNHQSIQDDPGIWAAILPWWKVTSNKLRWVLCTEDVFFFKKWLQSILAGGNVMPLDRSGSLEQPLFEVFKEKLDQGLWCHIFPEGRIWQSWRFADNEPHLGPFKIGVGKLIAHSVTTPIVLPIYHKGMDTVVPEKQPQDRRSKKPAKPISIFPQTGKNITVYIGEPIDFTDKIKRFKEDYPGKLTKWHSTAEAIDLYTEITYEIRHKMLLLESEAYNRQSFVSTNQSTNSLYI